MNKRILSVVLALTLCVALCATSFGNAMMLKKSELVDTARDKGQAFYAGQKEAILAADEAFPELGLWDTLQDAYGVYKSEDGQSKIKALAEQTADTLLSGGMAEFKLEDGKVVPVINESVKDFYTWKLLRDIVDDGEESADIQPSASASDAVKAEYAQWLAASQEYEAANQVSASAPNAALNSVGNYSKEANKEFQALADLYEANPDAFVVSDRFVLYVTAARAAEGAVAFDKDIKDFNDAIYADAKDIIVNAIMESTKALAQTLTFNAPQPTIAMADYISDKSLKGAFLFAGEDLVRQMMNNFSVFTGAASSVDKDPFIEALAPKAGAIQNANNKTEIDTLYELAKSMIVLANEQEYPDDFNQIKVDVLGRTGLDVEEHATALVDYLKAAFEVVNKDHAVELIHLDIAVGKFLLQPVTGSAVTVTAGEVSEPQQLKYYNSIVEKYPSAKKLLDDIKIISLTPESEKDATIVAGLGDGNGEFVYDATNAKAGDKTLVAIFRGDDEFQADPDEHDALRFVGFYSVTAVENQTEPSEPETDATEPSEPAGKTVLEIGVTPHEVAAEGTVTIKGKTNIPFVTIAVYDNDNKLVYLNVHAAADINGGFTLPVPYGAVVDDVYTVVAEAMVDGKTYNDTDTFKIISSEEPSNPTEPGDKLDIEVAPHEVAADATVTISGKTNIPFVTVAVYNNEMNLVYLNVKKAADINGGFTLPVPYGAVVDDVYTVVAEAMVDGKTYNDKDTFKIVEERDFELSVNNVTVTVKKTKDITATVKGLADSDKAQIVWEEIADTTIAEKDSTKDQNGITNDVLTVKGLKKGKTTVVAKLYVNNVYKAEATATITVTSGGSTGPGVVPTQPTSEAAPHKCEWPDIVGHWAHETIDIMTINGYIKGYTDGTFKPDNKITRAEFSALVYRILKLEEAEDGVKYEDTVGHWAEGMIGTMSLPYGYGMLRGYSETLFGPNDFITREQAIAIIARAKSSVWVAAEEDARNVFTDAESISWWFDGELDAAVTNGLVVGYDDGTVRPLANTTRAEACVLLARAWPEVLELTTAK